MISIVLFGQFVTNLKIILFDNLSVYSTLRFTSSWELEVITGHLLDNKKEITWSMTSRCIRSCSCCSLLRLLRRPLSLGDAVHNNEVETMSCEIFFASNLELCIPVACPVDKLLQRWQHCYVTFFTINWSQPITSGSSWSWSPCTRGWPPRPRPPPQPAAAARGRRDLHHRGAELVASVDGKQLWWDN